MVSFVIIAVFNILFVLIRAFVGWEKPEFNPRHWSEGCRAVFIVLQILVVIVAIFSQR